MTPVIETRRLRKRFRRRLALDDVTFSLQAGRILALVGPNGAGKTTLLRLAIGLCRPTSGEISVLGMNPIRDELAVLGRVAFLAQEHPLYGSYTVADMLAYGRHLNPRWDEHGTRERIAHLGISFSQRVRTLSGGQQAQVALAVCLGKRPDLLLLDEPLASLDPRARRDLLSTVMATVAETGMSVVLSSHDLAGLERAGDDLLLLLAGQVELFSSIEDAVDTHRRLVGAADDRLPRSGIARVVERQRAGSTEIVLVKVDGTLRDPRWEVRPVALDDLILAYLGATSARDPALEVVEATP